MCYHFNCIWVCYHLSAQRSACYRFHVTCSVKCVITSTVYGCVITYELNCLRVTASSVIYSVSVLSLQLYMGVLSLISSTVCMLPLSCYMQCKVCYHFNCIWVCYHLSAQRSACYRFHVTCSVKCVITSTVYGCVIIYELNCLRVTASSVIYSVKCVITSTVYGCVITYELNCLRVTASSVIYSVKRVITSTVYGRVIIYQLNCLRVTAFSVICSVSVLSLQLYMGVLSLISSTGCGLPLSVLHAV